MAKLFVCVLCEATSAGTEVKRAKSSIKICSWCEDDLARRGKDFCRLCHKVCAPSEMRKGNVRRCRPCDNAQTAARQRGRKRDKVRQREYQRRYRERHPDRIRDTNKRSYAKRRDIHTATHRAYYALRRDAILAKHHAYYWANHEAIRVRERRRYLRRKLAILRGER